MTYHVETFTGYPIMISKGFVRGGKPATDYHICDERGRTVAVVTKGHKAIGMRDNGTWHFGSSAQPWVRMRRFFPAREVARMTCDYMNRTAT